MFEELFGGSILHQSMADKKNRFEIANRFMAQIDRDRRLYGTINRGQDSDGIPVVRGKIKVLDGFILVQAGNQDVLGVAAG